MAFIEMRESYIYREWRQEIGMINYICLYSIHSFALCIHRDVIQQKTQIPRCVSYPYYFSSHNAFKFLIRKCCCIRDPRRLYIVCMRNIGNNKKSHLPPPQLNCYSICVAFSLNKPLDNIETENRSIYMLRKHTIRIQETFILYNIHFS